MTVTGPGYRPAMAVVREAVFSILESRGVVWGETRVLDLFAGSGSLGLEALSRGGLEAVFVEKDSRAAECLRKNVAMLGAGGRCAVWQEDVLRVVARRPAAPFRLIFVDPPYGDDVLGTTLRNVLRGGWLEAGGWLAAEVQKQGGVPPERESGLELDTDRSYGQTRILLWKNKGQSSIREPSIP
jgi:16S rRNA (guanine966-N2)-methyltransferase